MPSAPIDASSCLDAGVQVDPTAQIGPNCHLRGRIVVGPDAVLAGGITLIGDIQIGRGARLEPGVCLARSRPGPSVDPHTVVQVGQHAHIGAGSVLCEGVQIGHHAWVEPGTVVRRNVPPHAIVGGNPATISGYIDDATQAARGAPTVVPRQDSPGVVALQVEGVTVHHYARIRDLRGDLTVGEFERNVPFQPKRYFVVFDVPSSETRGEHAHKRCHQFLVCVGGTVSVVVDDGRRREEVLLDRPNMGLLIPAGIWGIQYKYSATGTLLVFASEYYDASDYIRNYDEFLQFRGIHP
ncbi:WxcM-like domain-containing protein [Pseudaquabacterium pictum]|uniref:Isomerase n=1 Tax=Pseudaquabacterium pictum TaxID=2315236 RepID=A0A480ATG0_9BURK|nr:WxcM-like domain-containing protein [Rubrivivax pictus]GCL63497.1 isomerase [Rubrivivax pictus]